MVYELCCSRTGVRNVDCLKTVISIEQHKKCLMNLIVIRTSLNMFAGNKLDRVSDNKITRIGHLLVIDVCMNYSNRDK
jgi:hypothetical protein